jgi:hypothetical protein
VERIRSTQTVLLYSAPEYSAKAMADHSTADRIWKRQCQGPQQLLLVYCISEARYKESVTYCDSLRHLWILGHFIFEPCTSEVSGHLSNSPAFYKGMNTHTLSSSATKSWDNSDLFLHLASKSHLIARTM